MSSEQTERVYFDGRIVPLAEAQLPANDRAVLYGFGFFETFRTSGGVPHHWSYNCRRLLHACDTAALVVPETALVRDESKLRATVQSLLKGHGLSDGVFRYTLTAGVESTPSELLSLRTLPPTTPAQGIVLRVLNLTRDSGEWLPRPKSLNYLNALMGARELQRRQAPISDEGLFLSRDGEYVVETVRQNLAWVLGGRLQYADPLLGGIAGTCLSWLLEQETCTPARVTLDELLKAEAVLVLNSVRGITPVAGICGRDDRPLRSGIESATHPLVRTIQQRWTDALVQTTRMSAVT
jgi:4-amino-4-deoxychorismate lyase